VQCCIVPLIVSVLHCLLFTRSQYIINNGDNIYKKTISILISLCLFISLVGCYTTQKVELSNSTSGTSAEDHLISIGFSQLGAESDWRSANSKSMKEAFSEENGYKLFFEDGQQKQSNQIMAIRTFIQQEVDYIILAPVTETGWDTVLQEAKEANIPVIIVDRMVDVSDESLFTCFVGSDFHLESQKVCKWMNDYLSATGVASENVHIADIQGNIGATAQIERSAGLIEACESYGWDLLEQAPADFTQVKGKEVMESFLKKYKNLNIVYCENDNEAFGAIEAIEEAGKTVGSDILNGEIMVISFDGVNTDALNLVLSNKISCIGECNPLHGPRVADVIQILEEGNTPQKLQFVSEDIYVHDDLVNIFTVDGRKYDVKKMTRELVNTKAEQFGN